MPILEILMEFAKQLFLPAFAESHGLCPWMNAKKVSAVAAYFAIVAYGYEGRISVGGCASAGSAEDGGATGSARGAPQSGSLAFLKKLIINY